MWRLLDTGNDVVSSDVDTVYLMESSTGDHLISAVVGSRGEFVRMFKLDEELKLWQGLRSLEGQVAFLSPTSCIVLPCKELENTIHFPRFHGDCNVFYSLSTRRFHASEGGYTADHTSDKELQLNSTWMVPEFRRCSNQLLDWNNKNDLTDEEDHGLIQVVDPSYFISGLNFSQPKKNIIVNVVTGAPIASPRLILLHNEDNDEHHHTFVDLATNVSHLDDTMFELFRGKEVHGSSNGLVLLVDSSESSTCVLLNTTSMTVDQLPPWRVPTDFEIQCSVIHQPYGSFETVVTVFGRVETDKKCKAMTIFCRVGDKEWTRCTGGILVHEAAAYQGKIYGKGAGTDFFEMELQQRHYKVTILERFEFPKDKHMGRIGHTGRVVESCGELLYFEWFKVDVSDTFQPTMDVRVSRVDLEGRGMEVVKDLGDRAFFFGSGVGGGFGCCASKSGFERNCIYFARYWEGNVQKYDYRRHRISTVFSTRDEAKDCEIHELVMFPSSLLM